MNFNNISAFSDDLLNVIIETPKGSQHKYDFDPELEVFKLNKTMPMGTVFPFDFGFIPQTLGEDGDPLDVLVIMDQPAYPGILVECRLLGMLEAKQTERNGDEMRNDRFVAVAKTSVLFKSVTDIGHLNKDMVNEICNFFIDYNRHAGKKFSPGDWVSPEKAMKAIQKQLAG